MDIKSQSRERPAEFTENRACWEMFAAAIIKTACDDYKWFTGKGRQDIERFFRSEYFSTISNIDPNYLLKNLREMYPIRTGMVRGG